MKANVTIYTSLFAVAAISAVAIGTSTQVHAAFPQTAPSPAAPPSLPARPLANPNIDYYNVDVRNGRYRAGPELSRPYAQAMSFVGCAGGSLKTEEILATDFGSREESKLIKQVTRRNLRCGDKAAGVPNFLMRAAMSESALKTHKNQAVLGNERAPGGGIDPNTAPLLANALRVAECQIQQDLGAATAVLMTQAGTPEERTAQDKLFSLTPRCGGQEQAVELDSVGYRAVIANVLAQNMWAGKVSEN